MTNECLLKNKSRHGKKMKPYIMSQINSVNIDENSDTPVNYGVRNIPTLLVFKNGEVVDKVVGNQPKSKLVEILESHM